MNFGLHPKEATSAKRALRRSGSHHGAEFRASFERQAKADRQAMGAALRHLGLRLNEGLNHPFHAFAVYAGGGQAALFAAQVQKNFFGAVLAERFQGVFCVPLKEIVDHVDFLRPFHTGLGREFDRIVETARGIATPHIQSMHRIDFRGNEVWRQGVRVRAERARDQRWRQEIKQSLGQ